MAGGKGQPSFARGQTRHEGQKPQDIKLLPDHDNMALVAGTNLVGPRDLLSKLGLRNNVRAAVTACLYLSAQ